MAAPRFDQSLTHMSSQQFETTTDDITVLLGQADHFAGLCSLPEVFLCCYQLQCTKQLRLTKDKAGVNIEQAPHQWTMLKDQPPVQLVCLVLPVPNAVRGGDVLFQQPCKTFIIGMLQRGTSS
eukprot:4969127-Amphidinium_carterae.1